MWIIYKNGIGFSKFIAEMLQDYLEDYIDVAVRTTEKIDPEFLIEEKFDFLMIGDIISNEIPSIELKKWLHKYWEVFKKKNLVLKAVTGFYVKLTEIKVKPFWVETLHD